MSISDILGSLGSGINTVANGLGGALFPGDPNQSQYVDPAQATAARNNSLIQLGLGIMKAPYSMTGMGSGLLDAYQGSQQGYQSAMDNAFKHTLIKRQLDQQSQDRDFLQQERAIQLKQGDLGLKQAERADRTQAATVAQRVLKGLSTASDPTAYLGLIQNDPDVKDAFSSLGIQSPYVGPMANPGNLDQFKQQLTTAAAAAPPVAPIKLSQGDVLLDPNNPSGTPLASAAPKSTVEYKDAGDRLIPVNNVTGQVVQGLPAIPKSLTVAQQRQVDGQTLTPEAIDLAARRLKNGEEASKVLANFGRGSQGAANIAAVQNRFAQLAATPDANGQTMGAEDIATRVQELAAEKRSRLELGAREGRIAPRVQEAINFAGIAKQASADVPRSGFLPWNKLSQMADTQLSDPKLAKLKAATVSLINAYAASVGGGAIHVHDQETAGKLLSSAQSPEAYNAVVDQLITESKAALASPKQVMSDLRKNSTGKTTASSNAPAGADGKPLW